MSVAEWLDRTMMAGIDPLISSYLEAIVQKGEIIKFPYLGELENTDEESDRP